jgi:hypothetical protein
VSLRRDQLTLVNKAVNEKEELEERDGGGGGKKEVLEQSKFGPKSPEHLS